MKNNLELFCWLSAIVILVYLDPTQSQRSICFFNWIGLTYCPGCGLGKSIAFALDGNLKLSLEAHLMGIPVLIGLILRIMQLIYKYYNSKNLNYENQTNYC